MHASTVVGCCSLPTPNTCYFTSNALKTMMSLTSRLLSDEGISDLSELYHFMFFSDLEKVFDQPENYVRLIPGFFFRNAEFFRHFKLSAQFTCTRWGGVAQCGVAVQRRLSPIFAGACSSLLLIAVRNRIPFRFIRSIFFPWAKYLSFSKRCLLSER